MTGPQAGNANRTGENRKERSSMIKARIAARLTQKDVASILKVNIASIVNWEKAHTTPQLYQITDLREAIHFTGTDEELLQVFTIGKPLEDLHQEPCETVPTRDIVDSSDSSMSVQESGEESIDMDKGRRTINGTIAAGIGAALIPTTLVTTTQIVTGPVIDPDEYLSLVEESISTWWGWLNIGNYPKLERVLLKNTPILKRLANTVSPFQGMAASLAAQAKFIQIILATRNFDYVNREIFCADAVHFGQLFWQLSGNSSILTIALDWQGNTYTVCYHQPQRAIPVLNNAFSHLNSDTSNLIRSSICSNLSVAYAQNKDEKLAGDHMEMAHAAMPTHPERDPCYQCLTWNQGVLDALDGRAYLHLAEHFPNSEYARNAYSILGAYTSELAMDQGLLSGLLIKKADAARVLGKLDDFIENLTKGLVISAEIDSIRRLSEVDDVMGQIPQVWGREDSVQDLQKDISHALVVARR